MTSRHRASSMIHMYGLNYCADHTNGKLYKYSPDIHSDDGEPIIKQRDTAVIHGGLYSLPGYKLSYDEVEFIIVSGQTEVKSTGLGAQPPQDDDDVSVFYYPPTRGGIAATQYENTGDVSHRHPFENESFDEFTQSVVFKSSFEPVFTDPYHSVFNVMGGNGWVGLGWVDFKVQLVAGMDRKATAEETGNTPVCRDTLRLPTIGSRQWAYDDWYCVTISYNRTVCHVAYTNLTLGEEVVVTNGYIYPPNPPVQWIGTDNTAWSIVTWGAMTVNTLLVPEELIQPWHGSVSQIWIDDSFVDLTYGNRAFCDLDGVNSDLLGYSGSGVTGSQPRIYLPFGHPSDNRGTSDIGTWDEDFFYAGTIYANVELPPPYPPASTTPRVEIVEPFWENTGNWIDLSALSLTTFELMFGDPLGGPDFNDVFAVDQAALTNAGGDAGNRIQIQDSTDCTNAALYLTDGLGNVIDSMIYSNVASDDSALVPTNTDVYVVITSNTGNAKVKKWDSTNV